MPNYLLRISVGLFFTLIPLFTTFAQITQVGAVTNASGANVQTLTVNKPTGAVIGDVLIMTVIKHVTGNTDNSWVNDNAGSAWTTLVSGGLGGNNNYRLTVLYKVISVDWEPTSYTVIPTAGWNPNATYMQVSLMAYRGINIANPINVFSALATTTTTTGTTIAPGTITPTVNNSLLLMLSGSYRNTTGTLEFSSWTTATAGNFIEFLDIAGADSTRLGAASLSLSNASATGNGTITLSGDGTYRGAVLMALAPASIATGSIAGSPFCQGASVTVPFTTTGVHSSGNVFTAQLSDATGSFSSPTTIGTLSGTTSGSISAVLPLGLSAGTSYRIRVISSAPSITGRDNGSNLTISASVNAPTVTGAYLCIGGSTAVTLSASGASTGDVYKWYSAATSGTLLKTSSSNTDNTFTTPSLSTTTSYWVSIQSAGGCESARVQVDATMPSAYGGSQTLAGTDSWVSHIYDGIDLNTYYGTTTQTETFDQNFGNGATCFPFIAGANPLSIYTKTFSVSNRMNSSKRGFYTVSMGGDDGVRLYVDNNLVYNRWVLQAYTQNDNVLISLSGTSQLRYEYFENGSENRYTFQKLTKIFDNTLSTNLTQSVYQGQTGAAIGGDVFGTFPTGITGTGYQWYYSTTPGGTRTAISGATGATFSPNTSVAPFNVVGTYYIYRTASITSTNNYNPASYVATLESNAATLQVVTPPTITASTTSLTGFTYLVNNGPSAQQSFSVVGTNLVSNVTVTPPVNYEISSTSGSGFQSTPIILTQSGGSVASTTIYVRLKAGLNSGTYNAENIQISADFATTRTVACSGSVTLPTYCTMSGNTTYQTKVTYVGFNSISQISTGTKTVGYTNYSNVSTSVVMGLSYGLSARINTGGVGTCWVRVWFDWNADGDFNDSGEAYDMGSATTVTDAAVSQSPKVIFIPSDALIGQTRMRIAV
ncbi:MAG: GEVED domain-containing protein, partial [Paludibacter sp.]